MVGIFIKISLEIKKIIPGAALNIKCRCESDHINYWSSSEKVTFKKRKVAKINIALIVFIFLGGLQFQVFKVIF